jgi:hypothetical protein
MNFSPFQNLGMRQTVERIASTSQIELRIPQYEECPAPGCGYDSVLGSAKDQNCLICEGRGRIRNEAIAVLMGRVAWLDHRQQGVYMSMPTGETADVEVQIGIQYEGLFYRVLNTEGAYVLIDGKRLTIKSITPNRVEGKTSLDVRLAMTNPDVLGG